MSKKKILLILFLISLPILIIVTYSKFKNEKEIIEIKKKDTEQEKEIFKSNIIENVNYNAKDAKGNEYVINASKGEIDLDNNDIIFLTNVEALIKLNNSENIKITSSFGKYNIVNYDTIFSKNVIITYLDNKINGEYSDFSIMRNSMIVTGDVIYTNTDNILKADVMEINLTTKDIKIFMHTEDKKVNVKSLN
jgi:hypothetical protein